MEPFTNLRLNFYSPGSDELETILTNMASEDRKDIIFVGSDDEAAAISEKLRNVASEALAYEVVPPLEPEKIPDRLAEQSVVVFLPGVEAAALSESMLGCLDMVSGLVLAPITEDHFSRRPVFLVSIPKSGTHMATGLLEAMGLPRDFGTIVEPGRWGTLPDGYHNPCKEFMKREWSADPLEAHQFFRAPAIFVYRNPLDIVASEYSWYSRPDNALSHYLGTISDNEEKLARVISDNRVIGTIRDRLFRYIGWLDFQNVIPVSYEELVGSRGGGDDLEQRKTIWSLLLKLQISGNPDEIARSIYNENSPTFFKGTIGRHKEYFQPEHYELFRTLPTDFMELMGYEIGGPPLSKLVNHFRRRPLRYWRPEPKDLWFPRMQKESFFGYNIVAAAGQYAVISTAAGEVDLTRASDRENPGVTLGFGSLEEAMFFAATKGALAQLGPITLKVEKLEANIEQIESTLAERTGRIENIEKENGRLNMLTEELWGKLNLLDGRLLKRVTSLERSIVRIFRGGK